MLLLTWKGMTERMCMVLGLHAETPGYPPALQEARRRVWYAFLPCKGEYADDVEQVGNGIPEQPFLSCI